MPALALASETGVGELSLVSISRQLTFHFFLNFFYFTLKMDCRLLGFRAK